MSDVRSFGAVGDGRSDDTEALQHALTDGEGALVFERGDYKITRPLVVDLAKLGRTGLVGLGGTARLVMAGAGPAVRIVGTHLQGTADPGSFDPAFWSRQRMPLVENLEIVGDHPEADAIEAEGTMQLTVSRTRISGCRHGVRLVNRNRNVLISDCHIYDNSGVGVLYDHVSLHQSNIVGSHISYCRGGGVVTRGGDVRNLHIGTCDLESNHDPKGPPTANVLIDCSGSTNGTAEVTITGCTIQHNSESPDSANIRILGRGDEGPHGRAQWGHVTITGNVLSDVAVNVHLRGCRDVTLTGNTFWMGFEHNLLVEDCTGLAVGPNTLGCNPAYAYGKSATAKNAVVFRDSRDAVVSGLYVQGVHTVEAGLVFEHCDRFNITGCTVLDNDGIGLLLRQLTRSHIANCIVRDDRSEAKSLSIRADDCQECTFADNVTSRTNEGI